MIDIIQAVDRHIIPNKSICKKYAIKMSRYWLDNERCDVSAITLVSSASKQVLINSPLPKHLCDISADATALCIDLRYGGTIISSRKFESAGHFALRAYASSMKDTHFARIIIGNTVKIGFCTNHPYGRLLLELHDDSSQTHKYNETYDLNSPESLDHVSSKILSIFKLVKQINRITRSTGEFKIEHIRSRCSI